MKRFFAAWFVLLLLGAAALADEGGYVIRDYDVRAVLHEDNTVSVRETIDVCFSEPRHGIYRYLKEQMQIRREEMPEAFAAEVPSLDYVNLPIRIRDIAANDKAETESDDGFTIIRLGSENRYVEGEQVYTIDFTIVIPDDGFEAEDILYLSLLGEGWNTTIGHFSFALEFDKPLGTKTLEALQILSGRPGSRQNGLGILYEKTEKGISGEAWDIAPNQAVTVYANLPEGYYIGAAKNSPLFAEAALAAACAAALAILVLALKAPKKRIVSVPMELPPEGIDSAAAGIIVDESASHADLFSLIPWWAQQGYITMSQQDESTLIVRFKRELPEDAPAYQKTMFRALFKYGSYVNLSSLYDSFSEELEKAKQQLEKHFTGERALSCGLGTANLLLLVMSVFYGLALGMSSRYFLGENMIYGLFGAALAVAGILNACAERNTLRGTFGKVLRGVLMALAMAALLLITAVVGEEHDCVLPMGVLCGATALVSLAALLAPRMVCPTDFKRERLGVLLGLRDFIRRPDPERLKALLAENPDYYYDVLPYAMVFGLAKDWTAYFESLAVDPPAWYGCSRYDDLWTPVWFYGNLDRGIARAEASVSSASSSGSGSSGGGFSGGGAGGGGGGSW